METSTFKNLNIGDKFRFSRLSESGLLQDTDKPGRIVYTKISARRWKCDAYGIGSVGSINVTVYHNL